MKNEYSCFICVGGWRRSGWCSGKRGLLELASQGWFDCHGSINAGNAGVEQKWWDQQNESGLLLINLLIYFE